MRSGGVSPLRAEVLTLVRMHSHRTLGSRSTGPALVLAAAFAAAACTSGNEPVKLTPAEHAALMKQEAAQSAASSSNPAAANPHAGMAPGGHGGSMTGAMPKSAGALQYSVPEGWITQVPSSSMRKAQFLLPKEGNDPEDAQLVLFHFGGEGGSVDANLERWAGEFDQADGRATKDVMVTSTRTVNDMKVTEVSMSGRFVPSQMPGQQPKSPRDDWSMLGAIVESPSGPYFAKLTGPKATVARWEASFRQWVSSLKATNG